MDENYLKDIFLCFKQTVFSGLGSGAALTRATQNCTKVLKLERIVEL